METVKSILELVQAKKISPEEARTRLRAAQAAEKSVGVTRHAFSSTDPIVADHVVLGQPLLPGAAHLALVDAALRDRMGDVPLVLSRVVFLRPVFVARRAEIEIAITPKDGARVAWEVRSRTAEGASQVHSRGEATPRTEPVSSSPSPSRSLLDDARARCHRRVAGKAHYARFTAIGVHYGPFFSTVRAIEHGERDVVTTLVHDGAPSARLAAVLDGAVQSVSALHADRPDQKPNVPFAMEKIHILRTVPQTSYAHVRLTKPGECEIVISSEDGAPCIVVESLSYRELTQPGARPSAAPAAQAPRAVARPASPAPAGGGVRAHVERVVSETIASTLGRSDGELDLDKPFSEYGVDSIILVELVNGLNERLGIELKTTALFDHPSLGELTRFICEAHGGAMAVAGTPEPAARPQVAPAPAPRASTTRQVAIIGMSCRFAGARSPRELWQNLTAGKCSITEVPSDRWDAARYYDPDPRTPGKTNSRWGGFVDDVDAFDPLFFNISGKEAELTDPQQRLFLEACWHALEDAGYGSDAIAGVRCGVYAGVPASDYVNLITASGADPDAHVLMGNDTAILPARISYLLNLKGPSIALNTACSSSLVALHLAVQAIESGQCDMALAGGVCLFVTPSFYLSSAKAGMLSPDGLCKTFDQGANGFVPGDGVGVLTLKALDDAERDGDHIYGIVLASDTNQDGKTNGITAPSSLSQTAVQLAAYERAGINPETIGCIEAHGTGTKLGDPIEIEALTRAFAKHTDRKQFCAIGSIKTNIGHTGQAAGAASIVKLLLSFEHEVIPPSLHFSQPNERIDFAQSPFFVASATTPWRRRADAPRRAAVSSFGYSGTNAHVVLEEPPRREPVRDAGHPQLFLISAKTATALSQKLADLDAWLGAEGRTTSAVDIAFTLHAGRKHFPKRAAFVASTVDELRAAIARARSSDLAEPTRLKPAEKQEEKERVRAELSTVDVVGRALLETIGDLYERGMDLEPELLHAGGKGHRVPMPTYPFARERYWVAPAAAPVGAALALPAATGLLTEVDSATAGERRFAFRPTGREFYVADHVVKGKPILAAAMSLELACAAGALAATNVTQLRDITWRRPLPGDAPGGLSLRLRPGTTTSFELDVVGSEARTPCASGVLGNEPLAPAHVDLAAVRRRCVSVLGGEDCYARFRAIAFDYGPGFQVIRELAFREGEVLARLELPASAAGSSPSFRLHPALLDGALQSMIGLGAGAAGTTTYVPYALGALEIHAPLAGPCFAHVQRTGDDTLDIAIVSPEGRVLVALRGLVAARASTIEASTAAVSRLFFRPVWREIAPAASRTTGPVLVIDSDDRAARAIRAHAPGLSVMQVPPSDRDWSRFLADLPDDQRPRRIVVLPDVRGSETTAIETDARVFESLLSLGRGLIKSRPRGRVTIVIAFPVRGERAAPRLAALGAFARTLEREHPDVRVTTLGLPVVHGELQIARHVEDLLGEREDIDVRIAEDGSRRARVLEEMTSPAGSSGARAGSLTREGGTYVITGGAGALGLLLARHLRESRRANVVLVGRSAPGAEVSATISALGATYERADVADRAALARALDAVRSRHGAIHGVIHAAGVVRDALVITKTVEDARAVIRPKVEGAVWLDELTKHDPLDFMVFFSSAVAAVGNPGQSDYAFANAFLDELAAAREDSRRQGLRSGKTLSIGWPAWRHGMTSSSEADAERRAQGIEPLDDAEGIATFEELLGGDVGSHVVVIKGRAAAVRALVAGTGRKQPSESELPQASGGTTRAAARSSADLQPVAETYLKEVLAAELRVPVSRIDANEPLEVYGIDSVMVMKLSRRLEADFGVLPKTLFFEYGSLHELSAYFADRHAEVLLQRTGGASASVPEAPVVPARESSVDVVDRAPETGPSRSGFVERRHEVDEPIAIVGVSGRYPMADDVEAFWANLAAGRDCITEIPADRWDLAGFFDPKKGQPGKSYSKWGGFLADVDKFDPLFFKIAPREADMMDPQERLFLETVWHVLEDAGYTRSSLRERRTGVFVGVMYGQYQLLASEDGRIGVSSYASIANRVSYYFDFRGPSIALDTMCSSSLTAIHLACESLKRGECDVAVAGGVNVTIHPRKYVQLSLGQFASTDGRCRSFGEGGDGYVPGEGVGAVLLKPLSAAIADGDTIHGVIRGTAVNHGGKTNGYTVPSPNAQSAAIVDALRRARLDASHVSFIEAHGTGTALGDPIEIAALSKAFGQFTQTKGFCPIGSAKSAIGHLESAAGIAAITKVVMQMRHGALPPSLHSTTLNPNIDFASSPFFVQRELSDWTRRVVREAGADRTLPRIAGVSSFGAGGANAHVVLEEWQHGREPSQRQDGPQILVLSARTTERLALLAERVATYLESGNAGAQPASGSAAVHDLERDLIHHVSALLGVPAASIGTEDDLALDNVARSRLAARLAEAYALPSLRDVPPEVDTVAAFARLLSSRHPTELAARFPTRTPPASLPAERLADIAFTLQVGREPMDERLAFVTDGALDGARRLRAFARGESDSGSFAGHARGADDAFAGKAGDEYLRALVRERSLERIAQLWAQGGTVDFRLLHAGVIRRRVSLPKYPFARERHWLPAPSPAPAPAPAPAPSPIPASPEQEITMSVPTPAAPVTDGAGAADVHAALVSELIAIACEVVGVAPERMDPTVNFGDYGFESVALKTLADRISERYSVKLPPTVFFERPSLEGVARWLAEEHAGRVAPVVAPVVAPAPRAAAVTMVEPQRKPPARHAESEAEPIAIIGMSGRFPGSPTLAAYWQNLEAGRDLVTEIPKDRWDWESLGDDGKKFRWGAFIEGADRFDPLFFGISPAEAEMMDPQQRVFLSTVWQAIEDAGYRASDLAGKNVGLFAGVQFSDYQHLLHEHGVLTAQSGIGNEHSIVLNRVSYLLDLRGPSEPVNTACSSSLVAVHRAIRSLRSGESVMAVAGGVALNLAPHSTIAAGKMGILSADGRCKTLDRSANGYVKGEGVGVLLLKPLSAALAAGDHIHAVIRGTAVNHGGRAASLTAPSSTAQAALITAAVEEANVPVESIGYVELHGTGTELGDPVEINGLRLAFQALAKKQGAAAPPVPHCGIGSVKTNMGHLEPASGIAGMIKVILAMQHRTLPGMLHLEQVNPYVDLSDGRLFIVDKAMPWKALENARGEAQPRRAGVSSFGFGGVNAHVVLEEFVPARDLSAPSRQAPAAKREKREQVLTFSAKTPEALTALVTAFAAEASTWTARADAPELGDVAFTLQTGREEMRERAAVVAPDLPTLLDRLGRLGAGESAPGIYRGQLAGRGTGAKAGTVDPHRVAERWCAGDTVEWSALHPNMARRRVPLPVYPFQEKRYWFTASEQPARPKAATANDQEASDDGGSALDDVHGELRRILCEKLKVAEDEIDEDRNLMEYGVDSILGSMIIQVVQDRFACQLPLTALADYPSLRALSTFVYRDLLGGEESAPRQGKRKGRTEVLKPKKQSTRLPPELLPIQTAGSRQISFWIHGATGYSTFFKNLSDALGPDFPVYAFQARGTDGISIPQSFDEMVEHYLAGIRLVQPKGPYFIGGYSFGGLLAIEIARRLTAEGEKISNLILFDTYPATKEVNDRFYTTYDVDFMPLYLANTFLRIKENPDAAITKQDIEGIPKRLQLDHIAKLTHERGNKLITANDIFNYIRGGLHCSDWAEETYLVHKIAPYEGSDVLFFKTTKGFIGKDNFMNWPELNILETYDYVEPWREIIKGKIDVEVVESDHFNILEEPTLDGVAQKIAALLGTAPPLETARYASFREAFTDVTGFGNDMMVAALRTSGALPAANVTFDREELKAKLAVVPAYERLFHAVADVLEREGYVTAAGGRLTVTAKADAAAALADDAVRAARAEELASARPDARDYIPLLDASCISLPDVLAGRKNGVDVLFPGGSMKLVAEIYKGNIQTDFFNRMTAERAKEHVARRVRKYKNARVEILEVGAGTGSTTQFVLDALGEHRSRVRYMFTDVGSAFLQMAKRDLGPKHPFLEFLPLDIERQPDGQGFEPASVDLVVAANVLHTTRQIDVTIANCKRLLKPGGMLVVNELTNRLDYNTLTFGLTTGWWLYEDEQLRIPGGPLLDGLRWRERLERAGFTNVELLGIPGEAPEEMAQSVIVARST